MTLPSLPATSSTISPTAPTPSYLNRRPVPAFNNDRTVSQPFGQLTTLFMTPYDQMLTERQKDEHLFKVQNVTTPKQALSFLASGILLGGLGSFGLPKLLKKLGSKRNKIAPRFAPKHEHTFTLQNPIASMFQVFIESPEFRKLIGWYTAASLGGYVGSNFLKGYKEAMVRRAEVSIRSKLLKEMNGTFRDSLRIKEAFDTKLKEQAKHQIFRLLQHHGVRNPVTFLNNPPLPQSQEAIRRLIYENQPWHQRASIPDQPLARFGKLFLREKDTNQLANDIFTLNNEALHNINRETYLQQSQEKSLKPLINGAFTVAGGFIGIMAHQLINTFNTVSKQPVSEATEAAKKSAKSGIKTLYRNIYDLDALILTLKKKPLILGYGLATGLALSAKLFIDGLREIFVTQAHADTEYQYQKYNWKYLDPSYHATAEAEALNTALIQLEQDLPKLLTQPQQLKSRIQVVLENIGRMSAPKYFLMTPNVGLVEARS